MNESWLWPDELDAVVAAPKQHVVMMENDRVRVLDTRVAPGETVLMHTHRWPATFYVVSLSDCVRRDEAGAVLMDSRVSHGDLEGRALWSPPLGPHTLENVGDKEIRVIVVEVKTGHPV